jgi:anti-sigma B factor antagonist
MPVTAKKKRGVSLLQISGDMTIYTAAILKQELMQHLSKPCEREIDLSEVSEMDSAGLQLLIMAKREAEQHKKPLLLTRHSHAVLEVMDICNMAAYFGDPIWEAEEIGK